MFMYTFIVITSEILLYYIYATVYWDTADENRPLTFTQILTSVIYFLSYSLSLLFRMEGVFQKMHMIP